MMLRPQVAAPTHVARLAALGLAITGAGLFAIAKPALETPAQQGTPTIAITPAIELALDVPVSVQTEAPPIALTSSRSVSLVFTAQRSTWMKLENLAIPGEKTDADGVVRAAFPAHAAPMHTSEDYTEVAIAPVALADVPAAYRERLGDKIIVDGACTAYITGFAIVARLTGSPGYAGDDEEWNAASVMKHGSPVLAAKLDRCDGTLARDGQLPPAATPAVVKNDADTVAKAKRLLLRSDKARATTKEWAGFYTDGPNDSNWAAHAATQWKTQMLIHPTTRETWVSIHAHQLEGCGMPHVNVFALYRVADDGSLVGGTIDLGSIETIEQLVDLDGDGQWEIVGKPWLGGRVVSDRDGAALERLDEPFYGCPC